MILKTMRWAFLFATICVYRILLSIGIKKSLLTIDSHTLKKLQR